MCSVCDIYLLCYNLLSKNDGASSLYSAIPAKVWQGCYKICFNYKFKAHFLICGFGDTSNDTMVSVRPCVPRNPSGYM